MTLRWLGHARPILATSGALALAVALAAPASPTTVAEPGATSTAYPLAKAPVITRALPAEYDAPASYEAQRTCHPTPWPGTASLVRLIKRTYGQGQAIGTSRGCGVGGTSEHKDGRALDWMTSVRSRQGKANAKAFLAWLVGPDKAGTPHGNATRLGIMYIGWNNRFWAAYAPERGWTELDNCLSDPKSGNDTSCHRNHIHISLTWDGASGRTSLWDGTVLPGFCPSGRSSADAVAGGRAADMVAVPPTRVLATRAGVGVVTGFDPGWGDWGDWGDGWDGQREDPLPTPSATPAPQDPCRLQASGWRGDSGGVRTMVTGQGSVPAEGVVAVAVTVTALGSTAPATIGVRMPKGTDLPVVKVAMNGRGQGTAIVPVASDGTIVLTTSAGATDLTVDVTGYYLAGDQPNIAVAAPLGRTG
ncbi:MAG: hypothetical protein Q8M17_05455 [Actinomycetota bacterium]|nr:hypothetical protein [Actinomycetota bacterium]